MGQVAAKFGGAQNDAHQPVEDKVIERPAKGTPVQELKGEAAYNKAIQEHKGVVIDIFADWCGPCQEIAPFYSKLPDQFPGLRFFKVGFFSPLINGEKFTKRFVDIIDEFGSQLFPWRQNGRGKHPYLFLYPPR